MKQAKIMLASIAVIAVVGGALAFKAHKGQSVPVFLYTSNDGNNKDGCLVSADADGYTTINPTTTIAGRAASLETNNPNLCTISVAVAAGE